MKTLPTSLIAALWLLISMLFAHSALAVSVAHLSTGRIDAKTSIIVELEGATLPIYLPVKKDGVDIAAEWALSHDHSFQYLDVEKYGLGEFEVSLSSVSRKNGLDKQEHISIYEASPSIRVVGTGPFVNASGNRAIPIEAVNATAASLSIYKVNDIPDLFNEYFYTNKLLSWRANRLRKNFEHVTDLTFKLPLGRPNEPKLSNLTLPDELENGWYIIAIKPSDLFDDPEVFHVLLSDIGLQAKVFGKNASLQAVDLKSGEPLSHGKVTIISKDGVRATAELNNGFAQFEYKERAETDIILVEHQEHLAILPLKEVPLDLSDFDVTGAQQKALSTFIFSNRDLFKPAETVSFNIVLRQVSGHLSAENSVFVEVIKPDGKVAVSETLDELRSGLFTYEFAIPSSAKLGRWTLSVKTNASEENGLGQFFFNVAEFVPERMDLDIDSPEFVVAGQEVSVYASGRYLYGQKAAGNRFVASSVLRSIDFFPGQYQDYFVGKQHYISSYESPDDVEIELNEEGHGEYQLTAIDPSVLDGPARLTVSNQLFESGGATTTRVTRLLVSNQNSVVGIRPHSEQFNYFDDANFSLLLLNHKGDNPVSGKVSVKLERNRGGYYWVYSEGSGWDLNRDDKWRLTDFKQIDFGLKPQSLSFPVEWGNYRVTATSPDGQETVYSFYVGWREGERQVPVKPDQLAMSVNKESYLDGESIDIEINSPVSGMVSLELVGDRTYVQKQVRTEGKLTTQIQLPESLARHDLYLIATLVNTENAYTRRLLAVQPIKLNRDNNKIDVQLEMPRRFEPYKTHWITVKAKTKEPLQDPYVVLTIADKGILNLSRYHVPDIFNQFYGQKRLTADIIDLYSRQFETRPSSFITHRYGGDGDSDSSGRPLDGLVESKTFNHVFAPVALDKNGEARIEVKVPDYNGEVQVVATVIDRNRFGHHVEDLKVSAPIVAELSVPRFFAIESTSQIMLEAANQTNEPQIVTLDIATQGGAELIGNTTKTFKLDPNEKFAFPVDVRVGHSVGLATFTLSVESEVYNVTRSWRVPVRSGTPYVTKQTTKVIAPGQSLAITQRQWAGILPIVQGESTVSFSYTPKVDPLSFAQGLYRYPYGCVEQTTSKAYPWLLNEQSLEPLKNKVVGEMSDKDMLIAAVARLENAQKSNGGFGLWGSHSSEEPWLTGYVANFLLQVQKQYPEIVAEKTVNRTVSRAKQHLRNSDAIGEDKAYIGYVLALHGELTFADASTHLKSVATSDSLSQAYLGGTFYLLGDMKTGQRFIDSSIRVFGDSWGKRTGYDYDSQLSSAAKIVSIITNLEKVGPIDNNLASFRIHAAEEILERIKGRRYFSTQEKFALTMAGFDLQKLNNQVVHLQQNHQNISAANAIEMVLGDQFRNNTEKSIYATESIEGFADPVSLASSINVERVKRTYFDNKGNKKYTHQFKVGDIVIAKVEFELEEDIARGMMIDYIPAGMVIEDPAYTAANDILEALEMTNSSAEMIEYRNDRFVTAGSYKSGRTYVYHYVMRAETPTDTVVPNVYIEDMYSPERFVYEDASFINYLKIWR